MSKKLPHDWDISYHENVMPIFYCWERLFSNWICTTVCYKLSLRKPCKPTLVYFQTILPSIYVYNCVRVNITFNHVIPCSRKIDSQVLTSFWWCSLWQTKFVSQSFLRWLLLRNQFTICIRSSTDLSVDLRTGIAMSHDLRSPHGSSYFLADSKCTLQLNNAVKIG